MQGDARLGLGAYTLDAGGRRLVGPGAEIALTETEARLLEHLARRPGEICRPEGLLTAVWGYRPGVRSKAVALTISRLRRKLPRALGPVVESVAGGGYRAVGPRGLGLRLDELDRLRAAVRRRGEALGALEAMQPDIAAALDRELPVEDQARLWLARAVWACQRQIHLPAVPLWALAEAVPSPYLAAECALWAARLVGLGGPADAVDRALAPWLARCPSDPAGRRLRGELLLTLGNYALRASRLAEARLRAEEALGAADLLGDSALRAHAIGLLGRIDTLDGHPERGRERTADALAMLAAAGEIAESARLEQNLGVQLYGLGELDEAEQALRHAHEILRAVSSPLDAAMAGVNLGTVWLARGAPDRALEAALAALAEFRAAVDLSGEAMARLLEGRALAALGRCPEARRALTRCLDLAQRQGIRRYEAHAQRYLCWVHRRLGDRAAAQAAGRAAAALLPLGREATLYAELWSGIQLVTPTPGEPDPVDEEAALRALSAGRAAPPWEQPAPGPGWVDAELTRQLRASGPRGSLADG